MPRSALLACGVLSSLLYVATDIFGALTWQGYHYASQAISELGAIGAPSRPYVSPLFLAYDLLLIAFGIGVRRGAGRASRLRVTGGALIAIGAVGLVATQFPMQMRGTPPALTDTMHIVLTAATVLCILLAAGLRREGAREGVPLLLVRHDPDPAGVRYPGGARRAARRREPGDAVSRHHRTHQYRRVPAVGGGAFDRIAALRRSRP